MIPTKDVTVGSRTAKRPLGESNNGEGNFKHPNLSSPLENEEEIYQMVDENGQIVGVPLYQNDYSMDEPSDENVQYIIVQPDELSNENDLILQSIHRSLQYDNARQRTSHEVFRIELAVNLWHVVCEQLIELHLSFSYLLDAL